VQDNFDGQPWENVRCFFTRARSAAVGLQRIIYGSDAAVRGNLPPKEGWQAFSSLPLSEDEFRTIAGNLPLYSAEPLHPGRRVPADSLALTCHRTARSGDTVPR